MTAHKGRSVIIILSLVVSLSYLLYYTIIYSDGRTEGAELDTLRAGHFGNRRIRKARFKREVGIKQKNSLFSKQVFIKNTQRTRLVEISGIEPLTS